MLVTFSCPAHADITMFGEVAVQLLKMMGHSGTVSSALLAVDVQPALEHLTAAVEEVGQSQGTAVSANDGEDEEGEPTASLSRRALPLIELLKAAAKAKCHV